MAGLILHMFNIQTCFLKISKILSRKGLYSFLKAQYGFLPNGAKVLLVGSGGQIADQLNEFAGLKEFSVTSVDIDEKKNPDICCDICKNNIFIENFDAVILSEVLEHLHTPQDAIKHIYKSLKIGGKVIITVPFIFPMHDRPYDYYRYTRHGLELLLRDFSSVEIKKRNNWGEAIAVLIVRHVLEKHWGKYIMVILAFLLYPFLFILGFLFKTDVLTTGYLAIAIK